jgi:hypothetical protein
MNMTCSILMELEGKPSHHHSQFAALRASALIMSGRTIQREEDQHELKVPTAHTD